MTATATHALIVGKFYPPHLGHHLLVDTAAATCDRVSVVVMASSQESIPLARRVEWMQQVHAGRANVTIAGIVDDVPVDYADPDIWDQHVALMRQALRATAAPAVTHVYTSEAYGAELARRFGARSVVLDRALVRVSATQVRSDVVGHWDCLAPAVQAGLAARIVIVGAASSGATTLAAGLAERWRSLGGAHGRTRCVTDGSRSHRLLKQACELARAQMAGMPPSAAAAPDWRGDEFELMAQRQLRAEDDAAADGGPVLFCDTDVVSAAVWHERQLGTPRADLVALRRSRPAALYLVTHHEGVPWAPDVLHGRDPRRAWTTARLVEMLRALGADHHVLTGTRAARAGQAAALVEAAVQRHWVFAAPIVERGK